MSSAETKTHAALVVVGHVDSGKSTTTGHLLYKCGGIDKRKLERFEREAKESGKGSFKFAWVLDSLKAERERGITIDIAVLKFETRNYQFTIIDAPGHRDFIKNMITGTAQADAGLLLVSAVKGEFEAGFSKNGQTKEHAMLCKTLGVPQMVVAINKMDDKTVNYSEARYTSIKGEVSRYLTKVGFKGVKKMNFVPISGWAGDNMIKRSAKTGWYSGPTLVEALDALKPPARPVDKPLRVPLQDVYKVGGIGTVPVGRVETGTFHVGRKIVFAPPGIESEVKSIEMHHEPRQSAGPGDNIGFNIKHVQASMLKRGMVCGYADDNPPRGVKRLVAHIMVLGHGLELRHGYTPVMDVHTAHVAVKFVKLLQRTNKKDADMLEENPHSICSSDKGLVELVPLTPVCCEPYHECPALGRFAMRNMGQTVAVGIIKSVEYGQLVPPKSEFKDE